jgi:hypothetical protein
MNEQELGSLIFVTCAVVVLLLFGGLVIACDNNELYPVEVQTEIEIDFYLQAVQDVWCAYSLLEDHQAQASLEAHHDRARRLMLDDPGDLACR